MTKHLIFDCDGVLIDSEYLAVQVMLRMLKPFGYRSTFGEFSNTFTGMLDTEILRHLAKEHALNFPANFYQKIEEERDREELAPISGMPKLVRSLDIPKSVVSNSHVAHVLNGLEICKLTGEFDNRIYSSEHVKNPKPYPDVYLHALNEIGLGAKEVLVVEDSLTGVQAAKRAGCRVIGFLGGKHISSGHVEKLRGEGVEQVAASSQELAEVLSLYF